MNGDEAYKSNLRKLIFVYLTMWRLENFRFYKRIASTLHHDTISKTLISAGELAISKDRGPVCRELKTNSHEAWRVIPITRVLDLAELLILPSSLKNPQQTDYKG